MEFLAESIGLLDMDGSGSGGTPKNKPAHNIRAASNSKTNGSVERRRNSSPRINIEGEERRSQDGKKKECNSCSKKTFNLALENLSDREICCRCDCQRSYGNQIDNAYNFDIGIDEENGEIFYGAAVHSDGTKKCKEEIAIESKSPSSPNYNTDSTQLTRLVTQRIDARTNYNCFTGNVDAVTGELLHGTLVYRISGEVYEGPFVTVPRQNQKIVAHEYNNIIESSSDTSSTQFETVSLRHGSNATSHFPNGMTFTGTYELDHPKFGKWIMKDNVGNEEWMYEGPLIVVGVDDNTTSSLPGVAAAATTALNSPAHRGRSQSLSTASATTTPINSAPSSGNLTTASISNRVIGTSNPLPGSVLFHGNGTFTRYSDGMNYKGEFDHGLAHGVGKEIVPSLGGDGKSVYQGEFVNGLRHGVGTLMEDVINDEDGDGCNKGDEYCEQCNRMLTAADDESGDSSKSGSDNGPDFAAGGSTQQNEEDDQLNDEYDTQNADENTTRRNQSASLLSQPDSKACKGCSEPMASPRTRRKQRYSSGVWCAGQFEIQDVVGTVRHSSDGSKEFVEDSTPSVMSAGTTWDLLPEKWLGLG
jgi:hypothetical protein